MRQFIKDLEQGKIFSSDPRKGYPKNPYLCKMYAREYARIRGPDPAPSGSGPPRSDKRNNKQKHHSS